MPQIKDGSRTEKGVRGLPKSHLCTMEGEPHLELEIQREEYMEGDHRREGWVTISCAPRTKEGRKHLETVARLIRMNGGKTFKETVKLEKVDENGDIESIEYLRDEVRR